MKMRKLFAGLAAAATLLSGMAIGVAGHDTSRDAMRGRDVSRRLQCRGLRAARPDAPAAFAHVLFE